MTFTLDQLTVLVEALREYRLRADLPRRAIIDPLVLILMGQLTKESAQCEDV